MNLKKIILTICVLAPVMMFSQKNIFDVARSGSVDEVKQLMAINPDTINKVEKTGYLPLTLACYNGNKEVALFLAKEVDDVNGQSNYGTPLMAAVFQEHTEIVQALLNQKANPNLPDKNGTTALHYAVMKRNEVIVESLVKAKANVNLVDSRGKSAMDYAVMTTDKKIIDLLSKNK